MGAPRTVDPSGKDTASRYIGVRLTGYQRATVEQWAEDWGVTYAEVFRRLLVQAIEAETKAEQSSKAAA